MRNKIVSRKSINYKHKKGRIVQFFNFHINQTLLIMPINAIITNSQIFDCDILLAKLEAAVLRVVAAVAVATVVVAAVVVAGIFFVRVPPHDEPCVLVTLIVRLSELSIKVNV